MLCMCVCVCVCESNTSHGKHGDTRRARDSDARRRQRRTATHTQAHGKDETRKRVFCLATAAVERTRAFFIQNVAQCDTAAHALTRAYSGIAQRSAAQHTAIQTPIVVRAYTQTHAVHSTQTNTQRQR